MNTEGKVAEEVEEEPSAMMDAWEDSGTGEIKDGGRVEEMDKNVF